MLDMGEPRRTLPHAMHPAPEEITGGTHLRRVDGGLWEPPPRRSTAIVWASMRSVLVVPPCMAFIDNACPRTHGMLSRAQRSANHYHVKSPFDADDQIGAVGRDGLHQRFWGSGPVPVEQPRSLLGYNTAIHGASMQIDAAVKLVRLSVEAPEVSSSPEVAFPSPSLHVVGGGGASISIKAQERTPSSVRSCVAPASVGGSLLAVL
jgi:hypothetical protein